MHKIDVQQQRYLLTIKSIIPSIAEAEAVTQTGGRQGVKLMRNQCEPITTSHNTLDTSASKSSIRRFVITEKAPTRAFSWLKALTSAFTFKTLLKHHDKCHKGSAGWLAQSLTIIASLMIIALESQFHVYLLWVNAHVA